jgi:hypothetical protein
MNEPADRHTGARAGCFIRSRRGWGAATLEKFMVALPVTDSRRTDAVTLRGIMEAVGPTEGKVRLVLRVFRSVCDGATKPASALVH